jgi:hypothetical protein
MENAVKLKLPSPRLGRDDELWVRTDMPWDKLEPLICKRIDDECVEVRPFLGGEQFEVDPKHLFLIPFTLSARNEWEILSRLAIHTRDLAHSIIRAKHKPVPPAELARDILKDPRLKSIDEAMVMLILKAGVAQGSFKVKVTNGEAVKLESSEDNQDHESMREFVASFGDELSALSRRVASIIRHKPSVGSYREILLQELLRKHLPARYHVATGFILGCPRQLDVLIYDQQDFAPVFRQGDMVVVQIESVRAVIEVKTQLNKASLCESLRLLSDVPAAHLFGSAPPMFKGIFAFNTTMGEKRLCDVVASYYNPGENDESLEFPQIVTLYDHLTSLCVHESAYLFTEYRTNGKKKHLQPVVRSVKSLTGLKPQSGLFWANLLSHLHRVPVERFSFDVVRTLGADIHVANEEVLAPEDWGPYGTISLDDEEAEARAREVGALVQRVQQWLHGGGW